MVATVLDIVRRAFRSMGVLRAGQEPTGADADDGLEHLQDIINALPLLMKGEWADVFLTDATAYEASDGERIHTNDHAAEIMLPTTYTGADGVTYATEDLSRVQILGADHEQAGTWVYSSTMAAWAQVDALALADDSPFGPEDTQGLAAMLAVSMVDEYGAELSAATVERAGEQRKSLRARLYREVTVPCDAAFTRLSEMGLATWVDEPNG